MVNAQWQACKALKVVLVGADWRSYLVAIDIEVFTVAISSPKCPYLSTLLV